MKFKIKSKISFTPQTITTPRLFKISSPDIKEWTQTATTDKNILRTAIFWLLGIFLSLVLIALFFEKIPNIIPLFYSKIFGPGQLANKFYLLLLPGGAFALGTTNFCFSLLSYKKERFISYIFCFITLLTTILTSLVVFNIIHLVT